MFHIERVVIDYKTKFPTVVLVNATDVFKDVTKGNGTDDDSVFIPYLVLRVKNGVFKKPSFLEK